MEYIIDYLYIIPIALIAIIIHELSHAVVSYAFGDPTPKLTGRLSLNPLKHLDPIGVLMLVIFHVGWAKPVLIDSTYYKKPRLMIALVSLAGPLSNFILALLFGFLYVLFAGVIKLDNKFIDIVIKFCIYGIMINTGLGLFNLIPIPPLDGSKILASLLPSNARSSFLKYERYGMFFLIGIVLLLQILTYLGLPSVFDYVINWFINLNIKLWVTILL